MKRLSRLAVVGVVSGAALALGTGSASATPGPPNCFGDIHAQVCVTVDTDGLPVVNPTGGPTFYDCISAGPPPCTPVTVPLPSLDSGKDPWVLEITCGGDMILSCEAKDVSIPPLP